MNLFRIIALAVLVWIIVYMVRRALGQPQPKQPEREERQRQSEPMVRCARCGVHVPESQALREGERAYCSREHRDEDRD